MPFLKIANLKNPLSNNDPIKKSRDTTVKKICIHQEIAGEIGIQIALLIDEHRIPGTIDLPSFIITNPNYKYDCLQAAETNQQAVKQGKVETKMYLPSGRGEARYIQNI